MKKTLLPLFFALATSGLFVRCASEGGNADGSTAEQQEEGPKRHTPKMKRMERDPNAKPAPLGEPELKPITFKAQDGLKVNAVMYYVSEEAPVLVLCHQAQSSKDEYREIAEKLNGLGYNCIAVDQRSGGSALGGNNETFATAKKAGKGTGYLDAEQDMVAAVNYASGKFDKDVILVGSSYSAALALKVANENEHVKAVAAFSPGEYFEERSGTFVRDAAKGLDKPAFLTCAPNEGEQLNEIASVLDSPDVFIPEKMGVHGARALWKNHDGSDAYWDYFIQFLNKVK